MKMSEFIDQITTYSKMVRELHSRNGRDLPRYVSVEEFVLANGKAFGENKPLPDHVVMGEPKQCFTNSSIQFMQNGGELAYVEGIAVGKSLGFPVHHAWLVDEDGNVYDPTWSQYAPGDALYFGVPFGDAYVFATMRREEYYGMLTPGDFFNKRLFDGADKPEDFLHPWFIDDILQDLQPRSATK